MHGFAITKEGRLGQISQEVHVKNSLRALILTRPGERSLYPELGKGISDYLFRIIYPGIFDEIREKVESVIRENEPRIILTDVRITETNEDQIGIDIHLEYRLRNSQKIQTLDLSVNQ